MEELHETIALLLKEQKILNEDLKRLWKEKNESDVDIGGKCDCGVTNGTQRRRGWRIKRKDGWGNDVETEV